jgi:hypothetical protein
MLYFAERLAVERQNPRKAWDFFRAGPFSTKFSDSSGISRRATVYLRRRQNEPVRNKIEIIESFVEERPNRRQALGRRRQNRLDPSPARPFQPERSQNRQVAGQQAGFAKRAGIGDENADLLHQSRRKKSFTLASRDLGASQSAAAEAHTKEKFRMIPGPRRPAYIDSRTSISPRRPITSVSMRAPCRRKTKSTADVPTSRL